MGGRFTVASGRPPESIRAALGDIELSLPAISCNGSLLYDFQTNRVLRRSCLNQEQAAAAIADMLQKFPKIGVEVMAGAGEMYVVHASSYTHAHQVDEHMESVACPLENVPGWLAEGGVCRGSGNDPQSGTVRQNAVLLAGIITFCLPTRSTWKLCLPASAKQPEGKSFAIS